MSEIPLRDLKRLRRIKATCTTCGTVRHFVRAAVAPIWRDIERRAALPATWDMACPSEACVGHTRHFIDWPDDKESA